MGFRSGSEFIGLLGFRVYIGFRILRVVEGCSGRFGLIVWAIPGFHFSVSSGFLL